MSLRLHKTKIVATIGPACDAPPILERMATTVSGSADGSRSLG